MAFMKVGLVNMFFKLVGYNVFKVINVYYICAETSYVMCDRWFYGGQKTLRLCGSELTSVWKRGYCHSLQTSAEEQDDSSTLIRESRQTC
jgi:hypothetical protein